MPHSKVDLPKEMLDWPGLVANTDDTRQLLGYAVNLSEEWRVPDREPYVFFATDFAVEGQALRRLVTETIVAVTGLPCRIGERDAAAQRTSWPANVHAPRPASLRLCDRG